MIGHSSIYLVKGASLRRLCDNFLLSENRIEVDFYSHDWSDTFFAVVLNTWNYFDILLLASPIRPFQWTSCTFALNNFGILTTGVEAVGTDKLKYCMVNIDHLSQ